MEVYFVKIVNSLTLNLLPDGVVGSFEYIVTLERDHVLAMKNLKSFIGHHDLAALVWLPMNRDTAKVEDGEFFLVLQYRGPRLPEKNTKLPEGAVVECHLYQAIFEQKKGVTK